MGKKLLMQIMEDNSSSVIGLIKLIDVCNYQKGEHHIVMRCLPEGSVLLPISTEILTSRFGQLEHPEIAH